MKIALLGFGKMGKEIHALAPSYGMEVVAIKTSKNEDLPQLALADVFIDFSSASQVMTHLQLAAAYKKNILIGTTGWENEIEEAKKCVERYDIGAFYAPNCSMGLSLFLQSLASFLKQCELKSIPYTLKACEIHHTQKKDAPSGTAKHISQFLLKHFNQEVLFESIRKGHEVGTHTITVQLPYETLTFTHQADDRKTFALGALQSAKWLLGKNGFWTLEDQIIGDTQNV